MQCGGWPINAYNGYPPNSPDLNPIENMFGCQLKIKILRTNCYFGSHVSIICVIVYSLDQKGVLD